MSISPGQKLQQARQGRGLSIEEAARATYIRPQYLRAMEADDASQLPSSVQGRGFLRNYAAYLGLDFAELTGAAQPEAVLPAASAVVGTEPPAALEHSRVPAAAVQAPSATAPYAVPARQSKPVVAAPPWPGESLAATPRADEIFKEIGLTLQEQRDRLSLSLEDIEEHTHIRLHYLKALEAGQFSMLPSFTQARGMLSHYARFLSLNNDAVLNRFAEALLTRRQEMSDEKPAQSDPGAGKAGQLHRFLTMDALAGSLVVILMIAVVIWGAARVLDRSSQAESKVTPPSVAEVLLSSPEATLPGLQATATGSQGTQPVEGSAPATPAPNPQAALPPVEPGKVQVFIVALQRAWMRVDVDGKTAFTGRVEPGAAYPYTADRRIELQTSNAGALQVYLNQQDLGSPGVLNEIVHLVYTPEGALLPTATATAVPTRTPRPSPTVPATATSRPAGG